MAVEQTIQWIYGTAISSTIRDTDWIIPGVQSLHICAIAVVIGSSLVNELRLAGLVATDEAPSVVIRRHLPWLWTALALLLVTGLIMVLGEPERVLANKVFWTKMGLVLIGVTLSLVFRKPWLDPQFDSGRALRARWVKPVAWLSLLVWVAVIFSGRWIAYSN